MSAWDFLTPDLLRAGPGRTIAPPEEKDLVRITWHEHPLVAAAMVAQHARRERLRGTTMRPVGTRSLLGGAT